MNDDTPGYIHLYDVGLNLHDSGRARPTRQTLIRRGAEFAERNGLRIFTVGRDRYVSAAEYDRVRLGVAA